MTHNLTHTAKCAERFRKHLAGSLAFLPGCFNAFLGFAYPSHHLHHETAHGFHRLILHLPGGVSVGTKREARVIVSQHTGDRLDVHAILQGESGEGMPLWHNKDKSENP